MQSCAGYVGYPFVEAAFEKRRDRCQTDVQRTILSQACCISSSSFSSPSLLQTGGEKICYTAVSSCLERISKVASTGAT
jgi:hypothetical protein